MLWSWLAVDWPKWWIIASPRTVWHILTPDICHWTWILTKCLHVLHTLICLKYFIMFINTRPTVNSLVATASISISNLRQFAWKLFLFSWIHEMEVLLYFLIVFFWYCLYSHKLNVQLWWKQQLLLFSISSIPLECMWGFVSFILIINTNVCLLRY